MSCRIAKIEYSLPDKILDNNELQTMFSDWNSQQTEERIGVRERHITAAGETSLDLAYQAGELVLKNIDKDKIGFLILCTQSPDYFLPTSACILQDKLGLKKSCGALDISLGCSGYIYGLSLAKGLIAAGIADYVLLITADTLSKFVHPEDKGNRSIFGDGAAATLIEKSELDGIKRFKLGTDGSGYDKLIIKTGGMRYPDKLNSSSVADSDGKMQTPDNLYMDGSEIFSFSIDTVPDLVQDVLSANEMKMEEVDYFIFHQANKFMLEYLRDYIEIPPDKFYLNMLKTGNTTSSTIPIALAESLKSNRINQGDKVLLAGFGVGLSWGSCIIEI
jgi:3-oxoacyl-[acyl-carrier-protein] synthase-3